MMRHARAAAVVLLLLSAGGGARAAPPEGAAADVPVGGEITVVLKSGAVFHGTLLGRDERNLQIRSDAGTTRQIPVSTIAHVEAGKVAPPPVAASATGADRTRVGLGVSFSTRSAAALHVPIQSGSVRVEPALSLVVQSGEDADATDLGLGLGVFGLGKLGGRGRAYYGGRMEFVFEKIGDGETSADAWALRAAPALGIEWAPDDTIAVGVEGQVGFTFGDASTFGIDVSGLLFVRAFAP